MIEKLDEITNDNFFNKIPENKGYEKITKYNSMFNYLPINYGFHCNLNHMKQIYNTSVILHSTKENIGLDESILEHNNCEYMRKNMTDVWNWLYDRKKVIHSNRCCATDYEEVTLE